MKCFGIMIFCCATLFAQPPDTLWTKTYGGANNDIGHSVQQTFDGGFIIAGETYSFGSGVPLYPNAYLIKTFVNGNIQWTRTFGGSREDVAFDVKQTSDSGYILVGYTGSFVPPPYYTDVLLIKTDKDGNPLWIKTYGLPNGNDAGFAVQQTPDSGFIIVGYTQDTLNYDLDVYIIKTDSQGDTLWAKKYGGTNDDVGHSIEKTSDGGVIIAGYTASFGQGARDVYLIKIDSLGDTLWTKTFGGPNWDEGYSVKETADKGFIITGYTYSFGAGGMDVYLIKTDSLGDTLWTKTYGGTDYDYAHSVQETYDKGFIICGGTISYGAGSYDVYLIRTDSLGDTLWTKTYGGAQMDMGYYVQKTSDNGFIITGNTYSFGSDSGDVYLIRIAPETNVKENNTELSIKKPFIIPVVSSQGILIKYLLTERSVVHFTIYDILGREIYAFSKEQSSGMHTFLWNPTARSNVYFIKFNTKNFEVKNKIFILKR